MAMPTRLRAGFRDPVHDSQSVFRALMTALSQPGRVMAVAATCEAPQGLSPAAAAVLLTLADFETPVWLEAPLRDGEAGRYVTFHTGAAIVSDRTAAALAVVDGRRADGTLLDAFPYGEDRYPERSATVILEVDALERGRPVILSGPGIASHSTIAPAGLADAAWPALQANAERFPLGIDIVFTAGSAIAGLPRSTRLTSGTGREG